jgi:pilus assembly protein FimV
MSSGKNPLMLMMALAMPGAAHALGLGDIHVDSALNERLAAQIDIVGATDLELNDLRAAVANNETFLRYGADRPAFLSSATFKVTHDGQGRPVLAVRSTEAFTEPLVNFLVDLRWHNGELVRQYTLLLDPAGFISAPAPAAPSLPAAPPAATPIVETKTQTVARQADPQTDQPDPASTERAVRKTTHIKVGAKATLRGVAWRVGERSEPDLQRMMIAIFRANPNAFDGNINRLHRGAVLTIPSHAELAAISRTEAKREIHAQMAAWHTPGRSVAANHATPVTAATAAMAATAAAATSTATTATATTATATTTNAATATGASAAAAEARPEASGSQALGRRIQSMEQELSQMKGVLQSEHDQMLSLQQQAARADKPAAGANIEAPRASEAVRANEASRTIETPRTSEAVRASEVSRTIETPRAVAMPQTMGTPRTQLKSGHSALVPILAGLGILAGALGALYFRIRRRVPAMTNSRSNGDAPIAETLTDTVQGAQAQVLDTPQLPAPERMQDSAQTPAADITQSEVKAILEPESNDATHPMLPVLTASLAGRSEIARGAALRSAPHDTTVNLRVDTANLRADTTRLDYNFVDLDMTAQHVQMPSVLNEHAVVKERRTNLADVLKLAIEREPDRHDLRMKLLELYYAAAATNRQAFLDVVQKFARDRDYLQTDQWDKIAFMGRQIASENPMFADESAADDDLADCA